MKLEIVGKNEHSLTIKLNDIPIECKNFLLVGDVDGGIRFEAKVPVGAEGINIRIEEVEAMITKEDVREDLKEGINKEQLEKAMQGHILANTQLLGLYKKNN